MEVDKLRSKTLDIEKSDEWSQDAHETPPASCASRCCRRFLLTLLLIITLLLILIITGRTVEQAAVKRQSSTDRYYQTPHVCAMTRSPANASESSLEFVTVANVSALQDDQIVAHCGDCGQCSNPNDLEVYDTARATLYRDTLTCARHSLLGGRRQAGECLAKIGLTDGCTDCWADNVMCTIRSCIFTCLVQAATHGGIRKSSGDGLNACTECDEVRCGPAFVECAGANRRRAGIRSDIQRDDDQVCRQVKAQWWADESIQHEWILQQDGHR